jgi:hypothetical protein
MTAKVLSMRIILKHEDKPTTGLKNLIYATRLQITCVGSCYSRAPLSSTTQRCRFAMEKVVSPQKSKVIALDVKLRLSDITDAL